MLLSFFGRCLCFVVDNRVNGFSVCGVEFVVVFVGFVGVVSRCVSL